ncbi:MAG: hypothetical protein WDO56_19850 [Gammaproteobacteria bacterium]
MNRVLRTPLLARIAWTLGIAIPFWASAPLAAREVRVGVLTDGPAARQPLTPESLVREATAIYAEGLTLLVPPDKRLNGNGTLAGVNAALDRLEADPGVDVVVVLGFVASHVAAHRATLRKPTIAALAVDPVLQTFPVQGGVSGRHNFTFVASFDSVGDEIATFHRVIGFSHMAVLVDRLAVQAVPELQAKPRSFKPKSAPASSSCPRTRSRTRSPVCRPTPMPVLVAPLLRLSNDDVRTLADELAKRKLPSFSLLGRSEVEQGILLTTSPDTEETQRLARRIALNIQRIVDGEDAANWSWPSRANSASPSICAPRLSSAFRPAGTISPMPFRWPPRASNSAGPMTWWRR